MKVFHGVAKIEKKLFIEWYREPPVFFTNEKHGNPPQKNVLPTKQMYIT